MAVLYKKGSCKKCGGVMHDKGVTTRRYQEGGMPLGLPLKKQSPYLVPEYSQPKANGYVLPDPNRPGLEVANANEYKTSFNTGTPDEIQVPTIVGGQYMGNEGALERYRMTGDKFKPMANPSSYSKFYDTIARLGLMQPKK